jgi:hypothetical protein
MISPADDAEIPIFFILSIVIIRARVEPSDGDNAVIMVLHLNGIWNLRDSCWLMSERIPALSENVSGFETLKWLKVKIRDLHV